MRAGALFEYDLEVQLRSKSVIEERVCFAKMDFPNVTLPSRLGF